MLRIAVLLILVAACLCSTTLCLAADHKDTVSAGLESEHFSIFVKAVAQLKEQKTVSEQEIKAFVGGYFRHKEQRDITKLAIMLSISSDGAQNILSKAPPEAVAAAFRSYLINKKTAWAAIGMVAEKGNVVAQLIPEFTKALADENKSVRYFAALGLRNAGPAAQRAVPELLKVLLNDPEESPRQYAAEALGKIKDPRPEVVRGLITAMMKDDGSLVDSYASDALEELDYDAADYISELVGLADLPLLPDAAKSGISRGGLKALPTILLHAEKLNLGDLSRLSELLAAIGPDVEGALVPLLASEDTKKRMLALQALSELRRVLQPDGSWITPLLSDSEPEIRATAIRLYLQSGANVADRLAWAEKFIRGHPGSEQAAAIANAGKLKKEGAPLLKELVPLLTNKKHANDERLRISILQIDPGNTKAMARITMLLNSKDEEHLVGLLYSLAGESDVMSLFRTKLEAIVADQKTSDAVRSAAEYALSETE